MCCFIFPAKLSNDLYQTIRISLLITYLSNDNSVGELKIQTNKNMKELSFLKKNLQKCGPWQSFLYGPERRVCIKPSRQLTVHWQPTMLKSHKGPDFHLPQSQNCLLGSYLWKRKLNMILVLFRLPTKVILFYQNSPGLWCASV